HRNDATRQGADHSDMRRPMRCAAGCAVRVRRRRLAFSNCQSPGDDAKDRGMASTGGAARPQVTVLGSADAFCSGANLNAAYLFETPRSTFLVDCGPSILYALKK